MTQLKPDLRVRLILKVSDVANDVHAKTGTAEEHDHPVDQLDKLCMRLGVNHLESILSNLNNISAKK
jgi:hypothetical protein